MEKTGIYSKAEHYFETLYGGKTPEQSANFTAIEMCLFANRFASQFRTEGASKRHEWSKAIELLEKYSEFLEKQGYIDTDWRAEEPYAIDEFLKTYTFPIIEKPKVSEGASTVPSDEDCVDIAFEFGYGCDPPKGDKQQEAIHDAAVWGLKKMREKMLKAKGSIELCPKCKGQGIVSKPPYINGDQDSWTSSDTSFKCNLCDGKMVIPIQAKGAEPMDSDMIAEEAGLLKELEELKAWKESAMESIKDWDGVREFIQNHPTAKVGDSIPKKAIELLKTLQPNNTLSKEQYKEKVLEVLHKWFYLVEKEYWYDADAIAKDFCSLPNAATSADVVDKAIEALEKAKDFGKLSMRDFRKKYPDSFTVVSYRVLIEEALSLLKQSNNK